MQLWVCTSHRRWGGNSDKTITTTTNLFSFYVHTIVQLITDSLLVQWNTCSTCNKKPISESLASSEWQPSMRCPAPLGGRTQGQIRWEKKTEPSFHNDKKIRAMQGLAEDLEYVHYVLNALGSPYRNGLYYAWQTQGNPKTCTVKLVSAITVWTSALDIRVPTTVYMMREAAQGKVTKLLWDETATTLPQVFYFLLC